MKNWSSAQNANSINAYKNVDSFVPSTGVAQSAKVLACRSEVALGGQLKAEVFKHRPRTLPDLRNALQKEIGLIPQERLVRAMQNFRSRIPQCIDSEGHYLRDTSTFCGPLEKELRKRLVKCFVWSVVLYEAETWTLRRNEEKRLEAFEMWICRRMKCVKWTDRIRNEAVLERVGEERMMLKLIRKRKKIDWVTG
ncbi:hypothetical protein ANN_12402 [Periplaneta americana]|uniref:Uncharacterized protein n=1 Tax=Periplaneta americana TaxID=6978 RepID=A0ABQ8TID9_PERAM|nr:hypothetical protein ANN_12402 [Periplaneta americana]